jgi:hypothetical protein
VAAAIAAARARSTGRLRHKGTRTVSILLAGGTRASVTTPYLRQEHRGRAARRRAQQQEGGARCYRVLEALGVHDRSARPRAPRSRCTSCSRRAIWRRLGCSSGAGWRSTSRPLCA